MRRLVPVIAIAAVACAGCANFAPPRPWEKGDLAKPSMQFGHDRLDERYASHIYASKEMAAGGEGVGGGGCGCN